MHAAVASSAPKLSDLHPDQLVDTETAAAFLGYSERTLVDWRQRAFGPRFIKIGDGRVRYRVRALIEWSAEREQESTKG
jgi:predicted DNA-binding transcriptional regulator AlpA